MDALDKNVQQRMETFFNRLVAKHDKAIEKTPNITLWEKLKIKSNILNEFAENIGNVIIGNEPFDIFNVDEEEYLRPETTEEGRKMALEHLYRIQDIATEIKNVQRARLGIFAKPVEVYEVLVRPVVNIFSMFAWLSSGIAPLKMAVELALTIYYQKKHRNVH